MERHTFKKKEHLKKSALIKNVFDGTTPFRGRFIDIYLLEKEAERGFHRAAFIIKKVLYNKKSYLRNRFRRVLKEAYRKTKHLLAGSYDIVIFARGLKINTKSNVLEKELANAFKKCSKK